MKPLHLDEKIGVILSLLVAVLVGLRFLVPAAFWFSVDEFSVNNALRWQDVTVNLDRTIHRDFGGIWSGKVTRWEEQGWVTYANTPERFEPYSTENQLPDPVTLEWLLWTEPKAYQLPCGRYRVVVTWLVNPRSLLLSREITRQADFTILGGKECTL